MPPEILSAGRKPRSGGKKVRTGCITCKIRHVKCDEGKPACLKCTSTGRKCDGYLPQEALHSRGSRDTLSSTASALQDVKTGPSMAPSQRPVIAAKIDWSVEARARSGFLSIEHSPRVHRRSSTTSNPAISSNTTSNVAGDDRHGLSSYADTLAIPSPKQLVPWSSQSTAEVPRSIYSGIPGNLLERQGFHSFRVYTVSSLAQGQSSLNVSRLLLQICHSNYAARHAAVALGAMSERFSIDRVRSLDSDVANSRQTFAIFNYAKALGGIRAQLSNREHASPRETLLSCFMFIMFEFLQGNDEAALVHLSSGLSMIRRLKAEAVRSSLRPNIDAPELRSITRIFDFISRRAISWIGLDPAPGQLQPPLHRPDPVVEIVERFSSLDDADRALRAETVRMHEFRRRMACYLNMSSELIPPSARMETEEFIERLETWPPAINLFIQDLGPLMQPEDFHRANVLHINYKVTYMTVAATLEPRPQEVYGNFNLVFQEIVDLSRGLLEPVNVMTNPIICRPTDRHLPADTIMALFSFNTGIIQPLYFTMMKCRNASICAEAFQLLSTSPWREGAWDSIGMAKMGLRRRSQEDTAGVEEIVT